MPILVELNSDAVRVSVEENMNTIIEFRCDDAESRFSQFFQWAKNMDNKRYYFVILKKPSGIKYESNNEIGIRKLGFNIGTDLVPEDYMLF